MPVEIRYELSTVKRGALNIIITDHGNPSLVDKVCESLTYYARERKGFRIHENYIMKGREEIYYVSGKGDRVLLQVYKPSSADVIDYFLKKGLFASANVQPIITNNDVYLNYVASSTNIKRKRLKKK